MTIKDLCTKYKADRYFISTDELIGLYIGRVVFWFQFDLLTRSYIPVGQSSTPKNSRVFYLICS